MSFWAQSRLIDIKPQGGTRTRRPHSALAFQTSAAFATKLSATRLHAALPDGSALLLTLFNRAFNCRRFLKLQDETSVAGKFHFALLILKRE
jgi:hypothetical protein